MSPHLKWGIGGVIVSLILLAWLPFWLIAALVIVAIAAPVAAWMALDESQRRRYKEIRRRRQLGR
jgi:hypothetical protein